MIDFVFMFVQRQTPGARGAQNVVTGRGKTRTTLTADDGAVEETARERPIEVQMS